MLCIARVAVRMISEIKLWLGADLHISLQTIAEDTSLAFVMRDDSILNNAHIVQQAASQVCFQVIVTFLYSNKYYNGFVHSSSLIIFTALNLVLCRHIYSGLEHAVCNCYGKNIAGVPVLATSYFCYKQTLADAQQQPTTGFKWFMLHCRLPCLHLGDWP